MKSSTVMFLMVAVMFVLLGPILIVPCQALAMRGNSPSKFILGCSIQDNMLDFIKYVLYFIQRDLLNFISVVCSH